MLNCITNGIPYIVLVKIVQLVQYGKYGTREWSMAIFPVVYESEQYFNWFIVAVNSGNTDQLAIP